jgi:UDP-N-acetylglucosamine--N-acetylmuramyl-(pentapeptide) pyrophosphoryl-undecaprenol N-acetylglucosamine transferase
MKTLRIAMPMKVVLTGGGTGGHIYPAVSVGQAIRRLKPDAGLLFIGSSHGPEGRIAGDAGLKFVSVPSSPLSGSLSLGSAVALSRLFLGIFRARRILDRFAPDVVIGTGGYTSAAVLLAQKLRHGKLVLHEQNVVPGRTNLWLSKFADLVCVSFEESVKHFRQGPRTRIVCTGMPVREEFSSLPNKHTARSSMGLEQNLFTVVVVGGSQGARKLNEVALDMWSLVDDGSIQIVHQTGNRNLVDIKKRAENINNPDRYHIEGYVDMPLCLASADLVLSRSGASTLAEISAAGLPSMLVPYPFAYADHQRKNAEVFSARRASVLIPEESLTPVSSAGVIMKLKSKPNLLTGMSDRSSRIFGPDVADRIAVELLAIARV